MLKYYDIISKLSDSQKIRIVSNVGNLSGKDLKILGIPKIKTGYMNDYGREMYPHAANLAHSWDRDLWREITHAKLADMAADEVDCVISPGAKIKLSPYRKEPSEDAYFASVMSGIYSGTAENFGVISALSGYYLTEADVAWMDSSPSKRVINELIAAPFMKALKLGGARAVLTDTRTLTDEYMPVANDMLNAMRDKAEFIVCDKATDDNTVELVTKKVICLSASSNALEGAYSKYKRLKQQIDRGGLEESALIDSLRSHSAISTDELDAALDNVLDFVFSAHSSGKKMADISYAEPDKLAYRATVESSVLLKNRDGILPLSKSVKVGIVGDLLSLGTDGDGFLAKCRTALETQGYVCSGVCRGYDTNDLYADGLIQDAVALANVSDVIILIMGVGRSGERDITKNETLSLPANQLCLANHLAKSGKKIIAVVSSSYSFDIEFSRPFEALLLTPLETEYGTSALADIISGEYNPSGKLSYTLYAGSDTAFAKRAYYKKEYGIKSGPFVGYKYYDTAGITVGYPFGHGLSYSKFRYSLISVHGRTVTFEIRNTSSRRGVEIAEVYIGHRNSSVIRPKRELCGFVRAELDANESRIFNIDIEIPEVYGDSRYLTEKGIYDVYIGASVSDIKIETQLETEGEILSSDGERLIDYIQSWPNIKEDKFTLEADYNSMKKSYKNISFGISALILAIGLAVFNTVMEMSSLFLGLVSAILAVGAIVFFVMESRERNRLYNEEREQIDEANKEHFEGAEEIPNLNAARLFHDEFDATDVSVFERDDIADDSEDESHLEYIDAGFAMADAVSDFLRFSSERGYKFARSEVENLLASFATSKLIITAMPDSAFNECIMLLSEYFGCDAFVDNDTSNGRDVYEAFYAFDNNGDKVRKNIMFALNASSNVSENVHISALNNAKCTSLHSFLSPFMRYICAPKAKNEIELYNEFGVNVGYGITNNFWIIVNLAEGESACDLPLNIARAAALVDLKFTKTQSVSEHTAHHGLNRHQLEYISERARSMDIPEDTWKKIDKLERYAREYSDYRIGNKLWLNFERHIALLLSCGEELSDAVDIAIATRLFASILAATEKRDLADDKSLADTVEFIFGAENTEYSREVIKTMLTDKSGKNNPQIDKQSV